MKMSEKEVDTSNELRVLSLFSGCGGMDLGFEGDFICHRKSISPQSTWVQEVIDEHWVRLQRNRFRTVFANDILKEAQIAWLQYMDRFGYDKNVYNTKSIVDLVKEHRAGKKVFPARISVSLVNVWDLSRIRIIPGNCVRTMRPRKRRGVNFTIG